MWTCHRCIERQASNAAQNIHGHPSICFDQTAGRSQLHDVAMFAHQQKRRKYNGLFQSSVPDSATNEGRKGSPLMPQQNIALGNLGAADHSETQVIKDCGIEAVIMESDLSENPDSRGVTWEETLKGLMAKAASDPRFLQLIKKISAGQATDAEANSILQPRDIVLPFQPPSDAVESTVPRHPLKGPKYAHDNASKPRTRRRFGSLSLASENKAASKPPELSAHLTPNIAADRNDSPQIAAEKHLPSSSFVESNLQVGTDDAITSIEPQGATLTPCSEGRHLWTILSDSAQEGVEIW